MVLGVLAAPLLRAYCTPRAMAFSRSLGDVATTQLRTLTRIVKACATTDYGRSLGLAPEEGLAGFRDRVPLVNYADIEPWIQRQRAEDRAVITPGRTSCYEPTSGSSGTTKWIPYNDMLLGSFRSLFAIWAHDLLKHKLRLRSGRTFLSISSPTGVQGNGFDDDREYLSRLVRLLIGHLLVMPPKLGQLQDSNQFRDALILALVGSSDLEIISIWNPSYLLILLEHFERHRERLLPALTSARRTVLERDSLPWHEVWPGLQLISCWTDVAAADPARRLGLLFPQATLQGKGLLATEVPVTVPLVEAEGCVPLIDEVFIEFEDNGGRLLLLHEAVKGAEYTIVITQAGGLLRYRLGDRVEVTGWYRGAPLLRFIGRADAVSDLVGEKLGEEMVALALRETAAGAFSTLLPVLPAGGRPHYCLLTDLPDPALADSLETALLQSFRYHEARLLGQLDAVQVITRPDMRRVAHDALAASGLKTGDIKDRTLIPSIELARKVRAYILSDQRPLT